MLVGEAVFQTVGSSTFVAVHACHEGCVDEGLAGRIGTLLFVGEDARFCGAFEACCCRWRAAIRFCSSASPLAFLGTGVGCFSTVVEAVRAFAAFAFERKKVELPAEGGLTVSADCFDFRMRHGAEAAVLLGWVWGVGHAGVAPSAIIYLMYVSPGQPGLAYAMVCLAVMAKRWQRRFWPLPDTEAGVCQQRRSMRWRVTCSREW